MSGLHPTDVKENFRDELYFVENSLKTFDYVAIGEIGIDLYWDKTFLKQQQEAFTFQIRLAVKNNLPIVIHCREAFDEIFEILDKENCDILRGVFHCFTGNLDQAKKAISLGFLLGIGGVLTFKNGGIDKFLNQINQRYAYNSIVQMSEREGFQLAQSENPQNGSVRLLLRKFS